MPYRATRVPEEIFLTTRLTNSVSQVGQCGASFLISPFQSTRRRANGKEEWGPSPTLVAGGGGRRVSPEMPSIPRRCLHDKILGKQTAQSPEGTMYLTDGSRERHDDGWAFFFSGAEQQFEYDGMCNSCAQEVQRCANSGLMVSSPKKPEPYTSESLFTQGVSAHHGMKTAIGLGGWVRRL